MYTNKSRNRFGGSFFILNDPSEMAYSSTQDAHNEVVKEYNYQEVLLEYLKEHDA